jgi:hypothetical protein
MSSVRSLGLRCSSASAPGGVSLFANADAYASMGVSALTSRRVIVRKRVSEGLPSQTQPRDGEVGPGFGFGFTGEDGGDEHDEVLERVLDGVDERLNGGEDRASGGGGRGRDNHDDDDSDSSLDMHTPLP